ncbi:hypothetical protein EYC98_19335 [Halieaceae bacterium IMCC14734]|uniref:Zinc-ribbon domain-containing protein n=2 Tax=Candidatus Litorirhabdus singularis TaxID=2518993 RepID=A0ABT3TL14_9GAMM|nr:hypothetical protein [Candidatus Litorirhabdus singularis]
MLSLQSGAKGEWVDASGAVYSLCRNRSEHQVCNGAVAHSTSAAADTLCSTCRLNLIVPIVEQRPQNLLAWKRLEAAKRRMISGLSELGLQPQRAETNRAGPMRFEFMEDKRSHPDVLEHFVSTGHKNGVITINIMEADEVGRVQQRELNGERYRTLLGHFRHEAGHYFFLQLVTDSGAFQQLFGDPNLDYNTTMGAYYQSGPPNNWQHNYISAYASSHAMEDWAECFAHYLHLQDTLETAYHHGLLDNDVRQLTLNDQLDAWGTLILSLNEVNRSLGVGDPYPFVISENVAAKLEYVHAAISAGRTAASVNQ